MSKPVKLSIPMACALENIVRGRDIMHGLRGRSEHGAFHRNTLPALVRRALLMREISIVDGHTVWGDWKLTPAGQEAYRAWCES